MKGISRAFGSVRQELDDDEAKVRDAATSYVEAVGRINERFLTVAKLRAEVVANRMDQETGIKSLAIPGR